MTRLYDRLGVNNDPNLDEVLHGGKFTPVVFDISNVADYYRRHGHAYQTLDAFPNVAPPFGCYWMEWRDRQSLSAMGLERVGALILGSDGHGDELPEGARWLIGIALHTEGRGGKRVALADWTLHVSEDGTISLHREHIHDAWIRLVLPERRRAFASDPPFDAADLEAIEELHSGNRQAAIDRLDVLDREVDETKARLRALDEQARASMAPTARLVILHPILLAHSLMACKNVTQQTHEPPEKLSKRHRRKKGEPLVTFRTLVITPLGGHSPGRTGRMDIGDGVTALHIVRGHFKTYTADRPLFGKRVGTYWWSPITRGKAEHGEVVKDYRVSAFPEAGPAPHEGSDR